MHYREFRPHLRLREFVKCLWTLRHDYSQSVHSEEHLPPKGEIELIFHFGHRFLLRAGEGWVKQPASFVIGQQERFFILRSRGRTGLVAARFHPWGAFPFLGLPISELNRQFVPLETLLGSLAAELEDSLSNLGRDEAVRILEKFLLLRLHDFKRDLRPVASLARRIIAQQGQLNVSDLLQDQSLSQRQIERRFNEVVGVSPKRLARIVRFQCSLGSIYANPHRELTEIAYEHGYSDQSHFISDFRLFSGKTPSAVRKEASQELPPDFDVEFLQSDSYGTA
jgi:AraC-like DNA-binding protein